MSSDENLDCQLYFLHSVYLKRVNGVPHDSTAETNRSALPVLLFFNAGF